jgi:large repetitive protein
MKRSHYLREIIDPLGRVGARSEYDEVTGRLKQIVDVKGKSVDISYDPSNSKHTTKDHLGYETTYIYDDRGNILTEVDAVGNISQRTYDDNNHLLSQTDREGHTTSYTYD